jgi:hypothetical protein
MRKRFLNTIYAKIPALGIAAFAFLGQIHSSAAAAADLLGLYVGGAVGETQIRINQTEAGNPVGLDAHQLGWQVSIGIRPLDMVGAEVEYIDLGHPSGAPADSYITPALAHLDLRLHGVGAFAVGYLPLPIPLLDVFGKAGVAHLNSSVRDRYNGITSDIDPCTGGNFSCGGGSYSRSDTHFAWGVGAQSKLPITQLRIRVQYERYTADDDKQSLFSVGLNWSFL